MSILACTHLLVDAVAYWRDPIKVLDFPLAIVEEVEHLQPVVKLDRAIIASWFGGIEFFD